MINQQPRRIALLPCMLLASAILLTLLGITGRSNAQPPPPPETGPSLTSHSTLRSPTADGTYPGHRFGTRWFVVDQSSTGGPLDVTADVWYPDPYVEFDSVAPDPAPGNQIFDTCTHVPAENRVRCTGTISQTNPSQTFTGTFSLGVESTCGLYTDPQTQIVFDGHVDISDGGSNDSSVIVAVAPIPDLTMIADNPSPGATDVPIETGGQGPLIQWHPPSPLACSFFPSPMFRDVSYRVYLRREGSAWQQIGYNPNCSLQIQLSPSDLPCPVSGDPAAWEWRVEAYDELYGQCRGPVQTDFQFTTASCRPAIEVDPQYGNQYFLDNVQVNNPYRVEVDWNGPAFQTPATAPYGQVYFELNGNEIIEPGMEWGAEHAYDMGADFNDSWYGGENALRVWATYQSPWTGQEVRSEYHTVQPLVYTFPEWAATLDVGPFSIDAQEASVTYANEVSYPEDPFEATVTVPNWVPYLGGRKLGILETQATGSIEASSTGQGTLGLEGQTGLGAGGFDIVGDVEGEGKFAFLNGDGLKMTNSTFGLGVSVPFKKEATLGDVIPGLRAMESWWFIGRIVRKINNTVKITGELIPKVGISASFRQAGHDMWVFEGSIGRGELQAILRASFRPYEKLWVVVEGGGTPYVELNFPANPDYLREVGVDLYIKARARVWFWEDEFRRAITCSLPQAGCRQKEDEDGRYAGGWTLLGRDYVTADYATFVADRAFDRAPAAPQASGATTETLIVYNAYPLTEPALAIRADGHRTLAYMHDDPARPLGQGTEIVVTQWDGLGWTAPLTLTSDLQLDFSPQVVYDGSGNGVAVWERSYTDVITDAFGLPFLQQIDIGAATWFSATQTWGPVTMLTSDNGLVDFAPHLRAGQDGSVLALWQTSDGADILGSAGHPLTYTYATWDGLAWSAPAPALTGLTNTLEVDVASYDANQAALAYTVDTDGVMTTTADAELYVSTYDGASWGAPIRLTNDTVTDTNPALVYSDDGSLKIVWLRGDDMVMLNGSLDVNDAELVRAGSTAGGFFDIALARSPLGHLALIWQAAQDDTIDLAYSVYDAGADQWGADQHLTDDDAVETALSPAFGADGTFYLAYRRSETEYYTETIVFSPTLTVVVPNLPREGRSDLYVLSHTVGRDLTVGDLSISPPYPRAGDTVTVTAEVRNAGDLGVETFTLHLFDDAALITLIAAPSSLASGVETVMTTPWTVPASITEPHTLRATVDPDDLIAEMDETNNTAQVSVFEPRLVAQWATRVHDTTTLTYTLGLTNAGSSPASAPITVTLRDGETPNGPTVASGSIVTDVLPGERATAVVVVDAAALAGAGDDGWLVAGDLAADRANAWPASLALLPDLTLAPSDIVGTDPFTVTVRNTGVATATGFVVSVRQDGYSGAFVYSDTLGSLAPGVTGDLNFDFVLPQGRADLWVQVDPDGRIVESDETNNLAVREHIVLTYIYLPSVTRDG